MKSTIIKEQINMKKLNKVLPVLSHKIKGYIALTMILILVPALVLTGITLMSSNINLLVSSKSIVNNSLLRVKTTTCLEEALFRLNRNPALTGEMTVNLADDQCIVNITNDVDPNIRNITINIESSGYFYQLDKYVDISQNPFIVSNNP